MAKLHTTRLELLFQQRHYASCLTLPVRPFTEATGRPLPAKPSPSDSVTLSPARAFTRCSEPQDKSLCPHVGCRPLSILVQSCVDGGCAIKAPVRGVPDSRLVRGSRLTRTLDVWANWSAYPLLLLQPCIR